MSHTWTDPIQPEDEDEGEAVRRMVEHHERELAHARMLEAGFGLVLVLAVIVFVVVA